jgi:hypothetical protein
MKNRHSTRDRHYFSLSAHKVRKHIEKISKCKRFEYTFKITRNESAMQDMNLKGYDNATILRQIHDMFLTSPPYTY